jgi:predicted small lipoprotein YifL
VNRVARHLFQTGAAALVVCTVAACGKKGPPQPPLRFVPAAPTDVQVRRSQNEVRLRFKLPAANVQGQGTIALDRVEIFAVTVAAESVDPPNRDLLTPKYLVGTLPVKPPPEKDAPAPPPDAKPDPRPAPGETTAFVEDLTEAKLRPQITTPAPPPIVAVPPAAAAAAAAVTSKTVPNIRRIYVVRGLTRGGRPGQPSQRAVLPLIDLPAPPLDVSLTYTEQALTVSWTAPVPQLDAVPATFNVYAADGTGPLNPAPLSAATFVRPGITFGAEECFVVRTAVSAGNATLESASTPVKCITPVDTFAPAAPTGLSAVGVAGAVNLIWEASKEPDLAGYIVLRGEAPGDTLQAITTTPIRETTYQDATAKPGVRYVYAVVALDRATPPNTSAQSNRVEESAR